MWKSGIKINIPRLLCGIVILFQLLWMQTNAIYPSINDRLYKILYYMKYFGCFLLLFYTVFIKRKNNEVSLYKKYVKIFFPLFIIIFIVQFFAFAQSPIAEKYGTRYWTRSLTNILDKICILMEVACIGILCGDKVLSVITKTLLIDSIILCMFTMIRAGFSEVLKVFLYVLGLSNNYSYAAALLEVHELTYCIGLLLIYYLYFYKSNNKKDILLKVLLIIFFILGGKRIGFAGIICAGAVAFVIYKKGLSTSGIKFFGIAGTVICMLYLVLLYNGEFMNYLASHNINAMGRDSLYSYVIGETEFSVTNLGWGYGSVSKVLENVTKADVGNMVNIRGLHNDILKTYIEFGFVMTILWLLFNLYNVPIEMSKKISGKSATLFMLLNIYTFITYLTDNTENYFVFQVILIILPVILYEKNLEER